MQASLTNPVELARSMMDLPKPQLLNTALSNTALSNNAANDDKENSKEELMAVAQEFESLFMHMMLKSMRQANRAFSEGGYFDSFESKMYEDMLDEKLSVQMSSRQSLGIADLLVQQLSPGKPIREYDFDMPARETEEVLDESSELNTEVKPGAELGLSVSLNTPLGLSAYMDASTSVTTRLEPRSKFVAIADSNLGAETAEHQARIPKFNSPEDFVNAILPQASNVARTLGVDAKLLVSQAALETGWGKHIINGASGQNSHNLFGIKANQNWQGETVLVDSIEVRDGIAAKEKSLFKSYASYEAALDDYGQLLKNNERYNDAINSGGDMVQFGEALKKGGYATDPDYARKLMRVSEHAALRSQGLETGRLR